MRLLFWLVLVGFLAGCATRPAAPVIERAPASKFSSKKGVKREGDWRPATHTVKRGETLYSIALEYGLDYRELASWNNIDNTFVIKIGQILRLKPGKDSVVTTPLRQAPVQQAGTAQTRALTEKPVVTEQVLQEPKAVKVPYSDKALADMQTPAPVPAKVAEKPAKTQVVQAVEAKSSAPAASQAAADASGDEDMPEEDQVPWVWPTDGKVVGTFGVANGKGIDIAGKAGQPVMAAGAGKVVYSGSGLRGYGQMIIIKHNKTYLSAYAHNKTLLVKEGQTVTRGQKIAEMGDTDSDRVELHFEIRRYGKPVDPAKYLPNETNRGI